MVFRFPPSMNSMDSILIINTTLLFQGMYKADICRAAYLYLHGGYYFDVDVLGENIVLNYSIYG